LRRGIRYFEVKVCCGSNLWFVTKTRNEDVAEETKPCKRNRKYRDGTPHHGPTLHQRGIQLRSVVQLKCRNKDDKRAVVSTFKNRASYI